MKNLHKLFSLLFLLLISCDKDDTPAKVIDLKAEITYEMVSQTSATNGTVKIIGHVKNVGNSAYISSADDQIANLVLKSPGASDVLFEDLDFSTVPKDGELTFSKNISWDTSNEFPPNFQLNIVYNPDILIDSSNDNDDLNDANNTFLLNGTTINAIFN